jgi:hypothetical protein
LPQSAFQVLRQKKTDWPNLDLCKFLVLDILKALRVSAGLHLRLESLPESMAQWGRPEFYASFSSSSSSSR